MPAAPPDDEPGRAAFEVVGQGIARVEFSFADHASIDPNVALSSVSYTLSDLLPGAKSNCLGGAWSSFHMGRPGSRTRATA